MLKRGSKLVVASHNKGKVWEINELLKPYGLEAISAATLALPEPAETETTFVGNARIKALAAARGSGMMALADDSGLEVDCLGGAPGVYSADWAGPGRDFGAAMQKVGEEITARHGWAAPGPRANFISVLCLGSPSGATQEFEGKVFGHLVWPPRGGNGFGYDPMFVADGETQTYGEMEPAQKYANSHRTRAFAKFKSGCLDQITPAEPTAAAQNAGGDLAALSAAAANLSTKDELIQFLDKLSAQLSKRAPHPSSIALPRYLDAMQMHFKTAQLGDEPKWRMIAQALLAASLHD